MGDALNLVQDAEVQIEIIRAIVTPAVRVAGMRLWMGLALIITVWTGLKMALGGLLDMGAVVRAVFSMAIPLGMLQFYGAALPGTGQTFPDLVTGMGAWVNNMVVADAGRTMAEQLQEAFGAFATRLGEQGLLGGGVSATDVLLNLPGLLETGFNLLITIVLTMLTGISMVLVWSLGQAQVMWAEIALTIGLMLGPIFIPWLMIPQLAWLFWGWFRTILIYSLYAAVASMVLRIVAQLGVAVAAAWTTAILDPDTTWTGPDGLLGAGTRTLATIPYVIGAVLASVKVGELTQLLILGGGNLGSNAGQAMTALRAARGGA